MALKGRVLPRGGTIGVPAPASGWDNRSDVLRGVEWWESNGYNVKLSEGIHERDGYVAGDPKLRANDLMAMFTDDEVDVVQTLTGGYGSSHLIPYLDFDVIRSNPKAFIGYSDITSLHIALARYAGLATFYGPGLMEVNDAEATSFTQDGLLKAMTSPEPLGEVPKKPEDDYLRPFGTGRATGEMVGGCLWLLSRAMGTPYQPDLDGKIFFFEESDVPPWYIDGTMDQMKQAGLFDNLLGVAIGELKDVTWKRRPDDQFLQRLSPEDVLERYIEPLGIPALYGLPLGHGKHLRTVPLGVTVTLDADNRTLTVEEPALEQGAT
jgi:muramoyltetrapeptide carboxypeptidase